MAFKIVKDDNTILKGGQSYWGALVTKRKLSGLYPEDKIRIVQEPGSCREFILADNSPLLSMLYNSKKRTLRVTFKTGVVQTYKGVTPLRYSKLLNAASASNYFATKIRNKYPCTKSQKP